MLDEFSALKSRNTCTCKYTTCLPDTCIYNLLKMNTNQTAYIVRNTNYIVRNTKCRYIIKTTLHLK